MAKYLALHINRYVIMLDGKYWVREDPTGDNIASVKEPLESFVVSYYDYTKEKYQTKTLDKVFAYVRSYFHLYNQVVTSFEPVDDPDKFNLSCQYNASILENPDYSKIEYFLSFLREVACKESEELYNWFLTWLAHICQDMRMIRLRSLSCSSAQKKVPERAC